jgi:hypothetical protein
MKTRLFITATQTSTNGLFNMTFKSAHTIYNSLFVSSKLEPLSRHKRRIFNVSEESCLLEFIAVFYAESQPTFRGNREKPAASCWFLDVPCIFKTCSFLCFIFLHKSENNLAKKYFLSFLDSLTECLACGKL